MQRCENGDRFSMVPPIQLQPLFQRSIILSLLHMAPFPAAPVSQFDRRMLDKISLQATETEESI